MKNKKHKLTKKEYEEKYLPPLDENKKYKINQERLAHARNVLPHAPKKYIKELQLSNLQQRPKVTKYPSWWHYRNYSHEIMRNNGIYYYDINTKDEIPSSEAKKIRKEYFNINLFSRFSAAYNISNKNRAKILFEKVFIPKYRRIKRLRKERKISAKEYAELWYSMDLASMDLELINEEIETEIEEESDE